MSDKERPKTKIMGILNVTPDSFFDGGTHYSLDQAIAHGIILFEQGADIIDIGGESTRPGSDAVSEEEELARVIPVIKALKEKVPCLLSIDTVKASVAAAAITAGASLINDVSGFRDPLMREVAASANVPLCVMHMQGTPKTMQENPQYEEGIVIHLLRWFENQVQLLFNSGIKEKNIIIDPGIGFGKTVADNLEILKNLEKFKELGFPILLGASRKSFLSRILNKPPEELLAATLAVNAAAILAGVDIIRVHDVKEHRDVVEVMQRYK